MKTYPKDYFEIATAKDFMKDKPLQTKQLTYFQDAMSRFGKNKYNVVASIILLTLVLMSILVPTFTNPKYYTETNDKLITLPPRVPLLEKFGIMDGKKLVEDQVIDYDTIDPETGLGYPSQYNKDFIDFDTLTNTVQYGTDKKPQFIGGYNMLFVDKNKLRFSIMNREIMNFNDTSELEIGINDINTTGVLEVYYSPFDALTIADNVSSWDDLTLIGTIDSYGAHTFDLSSYNFAPGYIILSHKFDSPNTDSSQYVTLDWVKHTYISNGEKIEQNFQGYDLSLFDMFALDQDAENGRYNRIEAKRILATFEYDVYADVLADSHAIIGKEEYDEILAANPGMEESIVQISDTEWTFGEGYPLTSVTAVDSINIPGQETFYNYHVMMSGMYELGLDKQPYFLFGTDTLGMDLFSQIFLGLRTSLILGVIATLTNTFFGIIWGAISAYYGGQTDILMERFIDIWGSFPQITMIGIITSIIGTGFWALYIFLVYDGWIGAARITRMQFYRFKNREYVLAARTLGASDLRIIFVHILPNALGTIVTRMILAIPSVIFLELNLSYLGFGLGTGQKIPFGPITLTGTSIGIILKNGTSQIFVGNLWMIVYPAIIVSILMITFNMFGNALRDALNPQLRGN
jgi:ABC-type dipeptide/oligopeptide/nickel transport system permease subunit